MSASLKMLDSRTRFAIFVIETGSDVQLLPTSKDKGKENLSTVYDCIMGSIAEVIDDNTVYYQLDGNDEWLRKTKSGGEGGGVQVDTLPTPVPVLEGTIYQYVGDTTSTYINGFFYKCINDNGRYKWENIPVQAGGETTSYNSLTDQPTLNGETIIGDKTASDFEIPSRAITSEELAAMWN